MRRGCAFAKGAAGSGRTVLCGLSVIYSRQRSMLIIASSIKTSNKRVYSHQHLVLSPLQCLK